MSSSVHKVTVDQEGIRNLLEHARKTGTLSNWADLAMEYIETAVKEIVRLKSGDFTPVEIHDFCHKLTDKVSPEEFARGCANEQIRIYGCAPHAQMVSRLQGLLEPADKMAEGIRRAVASKALDERSLAADAELVYRARRETADLPDRPEGRIRRCVNVRCNACSRSLLAVGCTDSQCEGHGAACGLRDLLALAAGAPPPDSISIGQLRITQYPVTFDNAAVTRYRDMIRSGDPLPALLIAAVPDGFAIWDGHHRYFAALMEGLEDVPAILARPVNAKAKT